jgi:glycosyltransferase involved in cell wall biosynthesis
LNHLLVCREYPPAPGGGIGAYTAHLAHLLASRGETVHVIAQQWHGAARAHERQLGGRLLIHRLPYDHWATPWGLRPHPAVPRGAARRLFHSDYPPLAFAWQVAEAIEQLVATTPVDVIEAPEYEAPLAVYLLRRAQGRGPDCQPPCLVHLHSPTELIARYNEWPLAAPDLAMAVPLEAFCLAAADGVLCPSQALAEEAAALYGLARERITVLPLPLGPDPGTLARPRAAWSGGTVAYVGRLERRKGVLEYLEAAAAIAAERPDLIFEFAGTNVLASDPIQSAAMLQARVPRRARRQFRFLGQVARGALPGVLRRARLAVVPSRWENFPYAAAEALRSGLPVLATRTGALPQMIAEGRGGWLVDECTPAALAAGLRRALEDTPEERQAMGAQAAEGIRALCEPEALAARHLALRAALAAQGPGRQPGTDLADRFDLPTALWREMGADPRPAARRPEPTVRGALALQPGARSLGARVRLLARAARRPRLLLPVLGWAAGRVAQAAARTPSLWLSARQARQAPAAPASGGGERPPKPGHD